MKTQKENNSTVKIKRKNNFRYLEFSVSSSALYRRWFGWETVSHQPGACITSRLEWDAVPFLFKHDYSILLGKVIHYRFNENKMFVNVICSRNPAVQGMLDDIQDGIMNNVSIGYKVIEMVPLIEPDGSQLIVEGERVYCTTKWELLEVSAVTVPADFTVGIDKIQRSTDLLKLSQVPANFGLFGMIDEATLKLTYNIYADIFNFEDLVRTGKIRVQNKYGTRYFVEFDVKQYFSKREDISGIRIGDLER